MSSEHSTMLVDDEELDPTILSKVFQWESDYCFQLNKHLTQLESLNQQLVSHYVSSPCVPLPKLPGFRGLRITISSAPDRPKGKMPIPVPRLIKTPEADELTFLPHYESLKEYCELEEKMPEIAKLYKSVRIDSYSRRNTRQVLPEGQLNDFLMSRFVQHFGTDPAQLQSFARILRKDAKVVASYLDGLRKRLDRRRREREAEEVSRGAPRVGAVGKFNKRLFCNICYVYCCNLHYRVLDGGKGFEKTSLDLENTEWPVIKIKDATGRRVNVTEIAKNRRVVLRASKSEAEQCRCGISTASPASAHHCFRAIVPRSFPVKPLTQSQLHSLFELLKLGVQNSCFLAFLLNDPSVCRSIQLYLKENHFLIKSQRASRVLLPLEGVKQGFAGTYFYHFVPGSRTHLPCNHHGLCTVENNCPCAKERGFCEKFCICREYCGRQFPGCECKAGTACSLRTCRCFASNRECDPDLCACCHQTSLEDLNRRYSIPGAKEKCMNMPMLLNKGKKMLLGNSQVCSGYGLFVNEPVAKGEFICEYLGELISRDEGERRGLFNDISGCTYLFDLTEDTYIDAKSLASKMRYANHASHGMENSAAKIVYVNGMSKIGLYALRGIEKGEEVLFNYRIMKKLEWVAQYKIKYKLADKAALAELDA